MIRQSRFIAVVCAYLFGCVVLAVGCAGMRSEAPQEEEQQGHTEATKQEQGRSPQAASEEARCSQTRTIHRTMGAVDGSMYRGGTYLTNDVPGCPSGGLLSGTDKPDLLAGEDGDDELRGLGARDKLFGGYGSDVIYGEPGRDFLVGGGGDDVLYGGDGDDTGCCTEARVRMSSTAGMATMSLTVVTGLEPHSEISSIAVKVGTGTILTIPLVLSSTMCRVAAR